MSSDLRNLALDTLHDRKDETSDIRESCFVVNEAGRKLRACGVEAIPVLEELMQEIVVPAMDHYRKLNGAPDWNSMFREGLPFAGLSEFLGAYWIICARSDPARAIGFMKTMTNPVINEAVSRLSVFFHPENSLSNIALPPEYIDYVNLLSESDIGEFTAVAKHVIDRLGLKESADR